MTNQDSNARPQDDQPGGDTVAQSQAGSPAAEYGVTTAAPVVDALTRLRGAARRRLLFQAFGSIMGIAMAAVAFVALTDYFLRMPWAVRLIFWVGGLAALFELGRRSLPAAWRFR